MTQTKQIISSNQNKKVLVGISGGVDSSVSALLLIKAGYQVEGVFAKVWQPDFVECTWRDEMKDAMRVCAQLKIPFHFLDLEVEYKKHVADYMISEYQHNRTPNPDVMCNTHIKFGFIYNFAMKKGFDCVATGHYAQNINNQLTRGFDANKDQSYFLWNVEPTKFKQILFPIGHFKKDEVRKIAQKNSLCTAEKKDSQGLCFIGPVDMKTFLKKLITTTAGEVFNTKTEKIGTHDGVQLYTIGERHGFTIDPQFKQSNDRPFFVVDKDVSKNRLIVDTVAPEIKEVILENIVFHANIELPKQVEVQFRYRQAPYKGSLILRNNEHVLVFDSGLSTFIAQGQSTVMYQDDVCLGGAIVKKVIY